MGAPPNDEQHLAWIPWLLCVAVCLLAVYVWGSSMAWHFGGISVYQIFPLLGLLAFSIMWTHYVFGLLRTTLFKDMHAPHFFLWTSYIVLIAIVLHPGLLAYQRFRDGFGLPPGSETSYVAHNLAWVVVLGMVSLLCFLAFELHRWFSKRGWWVAVVRLNDAAMIAIFYHGLRLGTQTHIAWFRAVWWFYGVTLVLTLLWGYTRAIVRMRKQVLR